MFGLGMGELVVIFFVILLLFGAKNLPEMAKSMGKAMRDFKRAANDIRGGLEVEINKKEEAKKPEAVEVKKSEPVVSGQIAGKAA